jgi:hypothetical protein
MYHGTAADITEFRPMKANAIFVTDSPEFANIFTQMSEESLTRIAEAKGVPYIGGRNVMPLYVRAEGPFDFENPAHVEKIIKTNPNIVGFKAAIRNGSWSRIEDPRVQDAIRASGFDSFYVVEDLRKNLAVYDPTVTHAQMLKDLSLLAPPESLVAAYVRNAATRPALEAATAENDQVEILPVQ